MTLRRRGRLAIVSAGITVAAFGLAPAAAADPTAGNGVLPVPISANVSFTPGPGTPTATPGGPDAAAGTSRRVDCRRVKCVSLTFDDGPVAVTGKLLDVLKRHGVKATFFVMGERAKVRPDLLRRMVREGHEIGNHTYTHARLTTLSDEGIRKQIADTQRVIRRATGRTPRFMRPPYGATSDAVDRVTAELGVSQILWSATSRDWRFKSARSTVERTILHAKRDRIVLMHDPIPSTTTAMPHIIRELRQRGFHIVPVGTLLRGRTLIPGERYCSGAGACKRADDPGIVLPPPLQQDLGEQVSDLPREEIPERRREESPADGPVDRPVDRPVEDAEDRRTESQPLVVR
ncbi:polysaccharide deacetylase family protein [Bailinhaonella thermotolerans]|uniref:Polysaccharide deacetylase family protein n=1 Tax=Bailinhaonella thermotolerans TaxID=1070861 RepID=A0A3A4A6W8_9ACTN|nr:polysaccharide deacetylase family protein [Bailinhaonella thermotolerans]RJL23619.1 polysaccharide deacetylase family protein [Bailinhaonella thermotolerans]